jgi:DNA-binding NtrC family response regulator
LDVQIGGDQQQQQRHRVLLVGNDCISKDVAAKLRRANYLLAKFDTVAGGLEAAAAVQFDFAVIDADGMDENDLANVRGAFLQRGLKAIAVMRCDAGTARAESQQSEYIWRLLTKPVAFEALVGAFRSA